MAKRNMENAEKARDQLRSYVGYSTADELEKLDKMKTAGTITAEEYSRLRARVFD